MKLLTASTGLDIVKSIFTTLGDIVTEFVGLLTGIFDNVVKLFWTTGAESGGQLTTLGVLMLIAMGTGLVIWGFNFLRSLIRVRHS